VLQAGDAIALGLADVFVPAPAWAGVLDALRTTAQPNAEHVVATVMDGVELAPDVQQLHERARIDHCFGQADLISIQVALTADGSAWAQNALAQMSGNSPTAMAISLELVRRGRHMKLADELRLERNIVHHCFEPARLGLQCEVVEGIRALAIDKDHSPQWMGASLADLSSSSVAHWLASPWAEKDHPLLDLV
jgi:enoyl-CoA hydratase